MEGTSIHLVNLHGVHRCYTFCSQGKIEHHSVFHDKCETTTQTTTPSHFGGNQAKLMISPEFTSFCPPSLIMLSVYSKAASSYSSSSSAVVTDSASIRASPLSFRGSIPSLQDDNSHAGDDVASETSSVSEVFLAAPAQTTESSVASSTSYSSTLVSANRRILHPPKTVILEPPPSIVPYAQLCFHQDCNTMSTMLVGAASTSSKKNGGKKNPPSLMAETPNLTLSLSSSDDDDESGSGWSTGYSSSENTDYYYHEYHRSHGVVWISREWWNRPLSHHPHAGRSHHDGEEDDDARALLQSASTSTSSSSTEEGSTVSLKSCAGKIFSSCAPDPRGSVHRAWGISLLFVVVYFALAVIESE